MSSRAYLTALGLFSLVLYLGLTFLSKEFNWGEGYSERPILEYLAVYFSLFVLYALACSHVFKSAWNQKTFWTLIVFGLLFRAAILPSQQIQEDDVYRYLWDGKVFATGSTPSIRSGRNQRVPIFKNPESGLFPFALQRARSK